MDEVIQGLNPLLRVELELVGELVSE